MFNAKPLLLSSFTLVFLVGCGGAPKPAHYGSNWKPVHAYTAQVEKRPLLTPRIYMAQPSDATLRGLLTRWGQEGGASLDYASGYEFSLVADAGTIQKNSLGEAIAALQAIYRPHGVVIRWRRDSSMITVHDLPAPATSPDPSSKSGNLSRNHKQQSRP